jgi:hypothetical protein
MMRAVLRFRLRTLLFVVFIFGVGLSWCVANARQHAAEMAAISQLRKISNYGEILTEDKFFCWVRPDPDIRSVVPAWLDYFLERGGCDWFDRVLDLNLEGAEFDDHTVDYLTTFTSLKELRLGSTRITGHGLRRLRFALPQTRIQFIDWRDVQVRSPIQGEIHYVAKEGADVKGGDLLASIGDLRLAVQYEVRTTREGTVRHLTVERIGAGDSIRERQLIMNIRPFDSLSTEN